MSVERAAIERVFREERVRILATLVRLVGGIDVAEDALAAALEAALVQWPDQGVPDNPRAWLVRAARNKAVDGIRRGVRFEAKRDEYQAHAVLEASAASGAVDLDEADAGLEDDRLRLIFTCCHPALGIEAQVALTLRTIAGLATDEIARAFLTPTATLAQRLVRAKAKITNARIPYRVPAREELPERLEAVLRVLYLVFNEGYAASSGDALVRTDLSAEAIRLARLVAELMPEHASVYALLALMLLTDARRAARVADDGELVLLEDQDRNRWDRAAIEEGRALVTEVLTRPRAGLPGRYALEAAIAALHCEAATAADTDWPQIASLYAVLVHVHPSAVVELNRAVAIAMADGPNVGLELVDRLAARDELASYHHFHAARADFLRRLGRFEEAAEAYRSALARVGNDPERRFLARRLAEVAG